ncbi:hypothetical protein [Fundidesulfovibrio terrae]|uniref:hypothetical protein n=1 Tax=Fundidesulfovibrio terrae TaxID=2922866 RepID=UPI001FAF9424|nr:hypothetical protein [Fundidesulfovibrio terrae]
MRRMLPAFIVLAAFVALAGCRSLNSISDADVAGTPTVYAKVVNAPNPLFMGHWRRIPPAEINKPWIFDYSLVKKGDKYAVYYFYDSRKKNSFAGWADFTLDGDTMTSGVDGVMFKVKGGEVIMFYPGRSDEYKMQKVD